MDYNYSFKNRANDFISINRKYPHAMRAEYETCLKYLELQPDDIFLHLGAGGNLLNNLLPNSVKYIPLEFNKEFAHLENLTYITPDYLPFDDASCDKILILALLHHFNSEERSKLYYECRRVLKLNGTLVIADVLVDSPQAYWLNTIVNKYNPVGHIGSFFIANDQQILSIFPKIKIQIEKYQWQIDELEYIKNLFYLKNLLDQELEKLLIEILNYRHKKIDWQLIFFQCHNLPCSISK